MSAPPNRIRLRSAGNHDSRRLACWLALCVLACGCLRDPFRVAAAGRVDADNALFGQVVKAAPPRLLQVALKFTF